MGYGNFTLFLLYLSIVKNLETIVTYRNRNPLQV
jgi:hypothetical protein